MIKYCSENKNCLTPSFVSSAISGITHRFVLVLECETRTDPGNADKNLKVPPRFAIGGPRATIDPRNAKIDELLPLVKHRLELPNGWEKVHQYMYVLQPSTDEHGWQYRSKWSNGPLKENDEQWVKSNSHGLDARRRLWITTVVKQDDLMTSKTRLQDAFKAKTRGVIMLGDLFIQESKTLRKVWAKRFCVLADNRIEVYASSGGKKIKELSLVDCDIKMLFGVQCPGREFAFSVRESKGQLVGLFDAENREIRRRWVVAIRYQLAIYHADVNFLPFDYGPPTGDDSLSRVLMCGELQKQGNSVKNWKNRFFQLTPAALQYFDKEDLKGEIPLLNATVCDTEKSGTLDFSVTASGDSGGRKLLMRADTQSHKATWLRAIQRQVSYQTEKAAAPRVDTSVKSAPEPAAAARKPTVVSAPAPVPVKQEVEPEPEVAEPEEELEATAEVTEMIRRYTIIDPPAPITQSSGGNNWEEAAKGGVLADEEAQSEIINHTSASGRRNSVVMVSSAGEHYVADVSELSETIDSARSEDITEDVFQGLEITADAPTDEHGEALLTAGGHLEVKMPEKEDDPEPEEDLQHLAAKLSPRSGGASALEQKVGRQLAKRTVPISKDTKVGAIVVNVFDRKRYI